MPATTNFGTLVTGVIANNYPRSGQVDQHYTNAPVKMSIENFAIAAADSQNSTYALASLPRDAVLLPTSGCRLIHGANMPDEVDIGDAAYPDALVNGYDGSSGAAEVNFGPGGGATGAKALSALGQPLWQMLGYATREAAPQLIQIIMTRKTAADQTTAASGAVVFTYTSD